MTLGFQARRDMLVSTPGYLPRHFAKNFSLSQSSNGRQVLFAKTRELPVTLLPLQSLVKLAHGRSGHACKV
jgi:hypothetical protein